ncbi:ABC transporter permease [Acinetobacter oleivorans]|uniref:ABC transporter permease n=1 Tax=Acinetobacter TaxID=469 RepID=UPI000DD09F43|nr:iron chelate uptake ABC transporter family permease subunit [Acinetobacter oleivorans]MDV7644934.1 iron chelate uptake ABC transporter family permease subunit [Acinetobacter baumannii]
MSNPLVIAHRCISYKWLFALSGTLLLFFISLFIGVGDLTWTGLQGSFTSEDWTLIFISRLPRTLALLLAGVALAVAGLLMQMLVQNRYVEPTTAGTGESAMLGVLFVMLVMPGASIPNKIMIATSFALFGTFIFLAILKRVPLRSPFLAPLVGLVLGGIIHSIATFFAYRYDMLQSLQAWATGDFSGVIKGRYEILWIGFFLTCLTYLLADRFTIMGMGEKVSTNLGINHSVLLLFGLAVISAISTVIAVTAGNIPFLGLIIPNAVSLVMGDNIRRSLPWIALLGGNLILVCDILGRIVIFPYEIPIGIVMGCVGSALFLYLIINRKDTTA